jgi:hypothetical protein
MEVIRDPSIHCRRPDVRANVNREVGFTWK